MAINMYNTCLSLALLASQIAFNGFGLCFGIIFAFSNEWDRDFAVFWKRSNPLTQKNGHETDLEMSPGPFGTTAFEENYIQTMGK